MTSRRMKMIMKGINLRVVGHVVGDFELVVQETSDVVVQLIHNGKAMVVPRAVLYSKGCKFSRCLSSSRKVCVAKITDKRLQKSLLIYLYCEYESKTTKTKLTSKLASLGDAAAGTELDDDFVSPVTPFPATFTCEGASFSRSVEASSVSVIPDDQTRLAKAWKWVMRTMAWTTSERDQFSSVPRVSLSMWVAVICHGRWARILLISFK